MIAGETAPFIGREFQVTERRPGFKGVCAFFQDRQLFLGFFLPDLRRLADFCEARFQDGEIFQQELVLELVEIPNRVHGTLGMRHGRVLERAHDEKEEIGGGDLLGQERALGGLTGQIYVFDASRRVLLGLEHVLQRGESLVGHLHRSDVETTRGGCGHTRRGV